MTNTQTDDIGRDLQAMGPINPESVLEQFEAALDPIEYSDNTASHYRVPIEIADAAVALIRQQQAALERVKSFANSLDVNARGARLSLFYASESREKLTQTADIRERLADELRAALAPHSVEISRVPAETTAEKPFNFPLWQLLESERLDLITVNAARREIGQPVTTDESQILLTAVAIVLGRLNTERQVVGHLAEWHDALRLKYAQLEGDLYHTKNKLAHAAKKHGSEALKSLVAQLPAQSRTDVLKSLPTGAAIAQEGRERAAQ